MILIFLFALFCVGWACWRIVESPESMNRRDEL